MGGFSYYINKAKLGRCISLRCRIRCLLRRHCDCLPDAHSLPVHFRKVIEGLGPTFVKFGQLLSLRPDVIPVEYCEELRKLQDNVPGFPYQEVELTIEQDLGKPISAIFSSFEKKPIAAASIAQVHSARLKNGLRVAVKILRPGVPETINQDIRLMEKIAGLFEKYIEESRPFRPKRFVQEFKDWTLREIDFRNEASHMQEMRELFKDNTHLQIPRTYPHYATKRVLVMEYMEGTHIDDDAGLKKIHADRRQLAINGVRLMMEQTLVHGIFHGDPHPGNLLVKNKEKFIFLDFGIVGRLSQRQRRKISIYLTYLFQRDLERALRHLLDLAELTEGSDVEGFRRKAMDILSACYGSLETNSLSQAFFQSVAAGVPHRVYFPADLVLLSKAFVTTESVGRNLYPQFSILRDAREPVESTLRSQIGPRQSLQNLLRNSLDYSDLIEEAPIHAMKMINMIERGEVKVKVDTKSFTEYLGELHEEHNIRVLSTIVAALIVGSAITSFIQQGPPHMLSLSMIQIYVALGLSLWIVRYAK